MRCENCQAEITFFMALRQAMPHRFRCLKCGARYRVQAPRLGIILLGIIVVFAALVYQFASGMAAHGPSFILPFMIFATLIWLGFEFLLHRHITRNGKLVRIDAEKAGQGGGEGQDAEAGPSGEEGSEA
jgi:hypothetical protein